MTLFRFFKYIFQLIISTYTRARTLYKIFPTHDDKLVQRPVFSSRTISNYYFEYFTLEFVNETRV